MKEDQPGGIPWWAGKRVQTPWPEIEGQARAYCKENGYLMVVTDEGRHYEIPEALAWKSGEARPGLGVAQRSCDREHAVEHETVVHFESAETPNGMVVPRFFGGYILPPDEFLHAVAQVMNFYAGVRWADLDAHNWKTWLERNPPPNATIDPIAKDRPADARSGFVYVLRCETGLHKIGRTANVSQRLTQLGIQIPYAVELIHHFPADNMIAAETFIHKRLGHARTKGEWFRLSSEEISWVTGIREWRANVIRHG